MMLVRRFYDTKLAQASYLIGAMDTGDASCSFLMDPSARTWSDAMLARLGLDRGLLPPIREPLLKESGKSVGQGTGKGSGPQNP